MLYMYSNLYLQISGYMLAKTIVVHLYVVS